jgi:hypothetical protein
MAAGAASITRRNETSRPAAFRLFELRFFFELMVCLNELFEPERSIGGTKLCCSAIPFPRLGGVGEVTGNAEPLQHARIVSPPKSKRRLRVIAFGCPV